jgi:hypothetical protein
MQMKLIQKTFVICGSKETTIEEKLYAQDVLYSVLYIVQSSVLYSDAGSVFPIKLPNVH